MSAIDFFSAYEQETVFIRQFEAKSPLFYRDVGMMAGVFTADLAAVRSMLPHQDLRPIRISPGRALVAIHCFEYRDCDIGPYNEVSLSLGVVLGKQWLPSPLSAVDSLRTGHFHGFVRQLPVTTDVALYGGTDFFNYPKYLASISFHEDAGARTCSLVDRDTGELIVSVRGSSIANQKARKPQTLTMHTYPQIDGTPWEARVKLKLLDSTSSLMRDHMSLTIGNHAHAADFRRLRLGRQLHYLDAPRCEAILFVPRAL